MLEHVALSGCGGVGGQMRAVSHIKLLAGASSGSEETRRSQMIWRCLRIQQLSAEEGESEKLAEACQAFQKKKLKKKKEKKKAAAASSSFFYFLLVDFVLQQASSNIEQHPSNCWMTETCRVCFLDSECVKCSPNCSH